MIKKRIQKLKKLIKNHKLDGYIIPKNDAYFSEFASPDRLKTISNFSGSAGFAIILKKENFLFVDGRYTLQAQMQSSNYYKIIEIPKFSLRNTLKKYKKKLLLGFDPQLFTSSLIKRNFDDIFNLLPIEENFIDRIYKEKNKNFVNSFYSLNSKVTGESINSKINRLVTKIKSNNIENIFISSPENVAWLLNLRGRDNPNSPIPNCKIILTDKKKIYFFSCPKKINQIKKNKQYKNLIFCTYKDFSKVIYKLKGKNFCIDNLTCSISNESIISKSFRIKLKTDPCYMMKSIKNKIEIKHTRDAHFKDGLALTKFIFWIKNINQKKITEIEAKNKLEKFRSSIKIIYFQALIL